MMAFFSLCHSRQFRTDEGLFPDGRAKVRNTISFAGTLKINSFCFPYCTLVFTSILDIIECDTRVITHIFDGYVESLPFSYEGDVAPHSCNKEIQQMQLVLSANRAIQEKDQTR